MTKHETLLERLNPVYMDRINHLERTYKHTYRGLKNSLKDEYHWTELTFRDIILLIQLVPDTDISAGSVSRMFEQREQLNII